MPTFLETRNSVRQAIGRSTGHMIGRRTYAATEASTAHVRMEDLLLRTANFGDGLNLYVASGGGLGQARTVVSTAPFVQGTGSIVYPHVDFTVPPSTDAAIELWRGIEATAVNGFIDDAIREVARRYLQHKEDYSIQFDPMGHWGSFERWPDGDSAAPSGWNVSTGTVSKLSSRSLVYSGRYSAQTITVASGITLESDDVYDYPSLASREITFKAIVMEATPGGARLDANDGVNTFQGAVNAGGGQEEIFVTFTVNANPKTLKVRLVATAAETTVWGKVWLEGAPPRYDFELPSAVDPSTAANETAFATISEVFVESTSQPGAFNTRVPNEFWNIDSDSSTRRIIFTKGVIDQYSSPGRGVKIVGQRPARLPTADTQNLEVDPEYVRIHAAYSILDSMPWDDMDRSKRDRLQRESAAKLADITTGVYPDSVVVEV